MIPRPHQAELALNASVISDGRLLPKHLLFEPLLERWSDTGEVVEQQVKCASMFSQSKTLVRCSTREEYPLNALAEIFVWRK